MPDEPATSPTLDLIEQYHDTDGVPHPALYEMLARFVDAKGLDGEFAEYLAGFEFEVRTIHDKVITQVRRRP